MTHEPRRPGPWDRPVQPRHEPEVEARRPAVEEELDKGQHPAVAVAFTLLFLGAIWYLWGSLIIAAALIFGLIVHEIGHVLAMNRVGMGPARIYIIPFLGGAAKGQREPSSEWHGVLVSLAGPVFGLLAAIPFFAAWFVFHEIEWVIGALVIALINLLNLVPAPPLDGSRALGPVLARIHPLLELGVLLLVGAIVVVWAFTNGSLIFAIFLTLALFLHLRQGARPPSGRTLSASESVKSTGLFLGAAFACTAVAAAAPFVLPGDFADGVRTIMAHLRVG